MSPAFRARLRRAALLALAGAAYALLAVGESYLRHVAFERTAPFPLGRLLLSRGSFAFGWVVVAPLVLSLHRRHPLGPVGGWRSRAAHLAGAVVLPVLPIVVAFFSFNLALREPWKWDLDDIDALGITAAFLYHTSLLVYAAILGGAWGVGFYEALKRRELVASRLSSQLSEARLKALEMQVHPHFLFNTLNTVLPLIQKDAAQAERTLDVLGELVRIGLEGDHAPLVPLGKELEFVTRYLEIERTRFRDRLDVRLDVGAEARRALVPTLLLQPLVENAIRHGISAHPGAGTLGIAARRRGDRLLVEVTNDGAAPDDRRDAARRPGSGIGLANTRGRLESLFGAEYLFEVAARPEGGTRVTIEVPFRVAEGLAA